jgi:type IV pilus modification protein PilV
MTRPSGRQGFTLISVLVALVILSVGLLALARTQAQLVKTQGNTAQRNTALTIARDYAEVLRSRDPATLVTEPAITVDGRGQASPSGAYSRTTVVTVLSINLVRVQVQVTYPHGPIPIELVTLIYRS